ncbi:unnamed protein product, partial [marine sediment metagenome]
MAFGTLLIYVYQTLGIMAIRLVGIIGMIMKDLMNSVD